MYLANTLGYNAKSLMNHYTSNDLSKIRYRVYFKTNDEIVENIVCQKKYGTVVLTYLKPSQQN